MGQTSECIDWGIDHGLDGEGAIPNFTERLDGYELPYIDGYWYGFLLRKAGVTERRLETPEQNVEFFRLRALSMIPRYPRKRSGGKGW